MTIIQPNQKKVTSQIKFLVAGFLFLLVVLSTFGVATYAHTVDLRHDIAKLEEAFSELQAENADLKDEMYSVLSPEHLTQIGRSIGLTLEKRPKYLETSIDALATQL